MSRSKRHSEKIISCSKRQGRQGAIFQDTLIALILLLVGFLLIFMLIMYMAGKSDRVAGEAICRASVSSRIKMSVGVPSTGGGIKLAPLLCKSFDIELPEKRSSGGAQLGQEQIKTEIAELMRRCWWQFGNGMVQNVFNDWYGAGVRNDCHVCYSFTIKATGDFKDGSSFDASSLISFMSDNKVRIQKYNEKDQSFGIQDADYSYLQYIQDKDGKGKVVYQPGLDFRTNRDSGGPYAIALVSPAWFDVYKPYQWIAGMLVDDKSTNPYILVSELEKISDICEIYGDDVG